MRPGRKCKSYLWTTPITLTDGEKFSFTPLRDDEKYGIVEDAMDRRIVQSCLFGPLETRSNRVFIGLYAYSRGGTGVIEDYRARGLARVGSGVAGR